MKLYLLNMIFVSVMTFTMSANAIQSYQDETQGFGFVVPDDWTVVNGRFHVTHYRYVQVCLNNIGDTDLQVRDWTEEFRSSYNSSTVSQQLLPGTVYIDIAKWDGPPTPLPPFAWSPDDLPDSRITKFLSDTQVHWESTELETYKIGFLKWGWSWDIRIYCRKPFERQELEDAFRIIKSLSFMDIPIITAGQAVEAAIPHLPDEAQPLPSSEGCGVFFEYDVSIEDVDDKFLVTFIKLDGTENRHPLRSFKYLVTPDGAIKPIKTNSDDDRPN